MHILLVELKIIVVRGRLQVNNPGASRGCSCKGLDLLRVVVPILLSKFGTVTITGGLENSNGLVAETRFVGQGKNQILAGVFLARASLRVSEVARRGVIHAKIHRGHERVCHRLRQSFPQSNREIHSCDPRRRWWPLNDLKVGKAKFSPRGSRPQPLGKWLVTGSARAQSCLSQLKCSHKIQKTKGKPFPMVPPPGEVPK